MHKNARKYLPCYSFLLFSACAGPKSLTESGRVTPVGEFRMHGEFMNHTPLETYKTFGQSLADSIDYLETMEAIEEEDYDLITERINTAASSAISYFVDPIVFIGSGFGVRYGVYERVEIGYANSMGLHVMEVGFQFLGDPGTAAKNEGSVGSSMYGRIAIKASTQSYSLPSVANLDKLNELLGISMSRTDFQVPITISYPFGPDEKYGALSLSVIYNRTNLSIRFNPVGELSTILVATDSMTDVESIIEQESGFNSFGGNITIKGGYRFVYAGLGLGVYHADYGTYPLFGEVLSLSGITIVPNVFIEGRY